MDSCYKTVSLFVSCYFESLMIIIYDAHYIQVNVLIVTPVC